MGTILIALPKRDDAERLASKLRERGSPEDIVICHTAADILRTSNNREFGVAICTKSLVDMGYADLLSYMPPTFGMIVLTKDASLEVLSDRMVRIQLPFRVGEIRSTIETLNHNLYYRFRKRKKTVPKRSEAEQQIIDEAKQLLINKKGLSEPEAYRYIQKNSMDAGRTFVESARMILLLNQ